MADNKLYTVAGTAEQHGLTKVRFANDFVARIKILDKNGCTNIQLFELPEPMTKLDALKYLKEQNLEGDAGYAVDAKLAEKMREAKRGEIRVGFDLTEIRARKQDAVPA
jgi:hypothetical protein